MRKHDAAPRPPSWAFEPHERVSAAAGHAEPIRLAHQVPFPTVTVLAVAPVRLVVRQVLERWAAWRGRDGIGVSPMSEEWLQQYSVGCEKHGEPL